MPTIQLSRQPVELFKLLKFEGLVASGGEAKTVISQGMVRVNGELEIRKRRKLLAGDRVEFGGEQFILVAE